MLGTYLVASQCWCSHLQLERYMSRWVLSIVPRTRLTLGRAANFCDSTGIRGGDISAAPCCPRCATGALRRTFAQRYLVNGPLRWCGKGLKADAHSARSASVDRRAMGERQPRSSTMNAGGRDASALVAASGQRAFRLCVWVISFAGLAGDLTAFVTALLARGTKSTVHKSRTVQGVAYPGHPGGQAVPVGERRATAGRPSPSGVGAHFRVTASGVVTQLVT